MTRALFKHGIVGTTVFTFICGLGNWCATLCTYKWNNWSYFFAAPNLRLYFAPNIRKIIARHHCARPFAGTSLELHFKPTLDSETFKLLNTKDSIVEYYQYFEQYYSLFDELVKSPNAAIRPTLPNTASPGKHDVEEGKLFAEFCRMCVELEQENRTGKKYFKYYEHIAPYNANEKIKSLNTLQCSGFVCGSCREVIGLLPNRMISGCHGAFVDLVVDYKQRMQRSNYEGKVIDSGVFSNDSYGFFCFPAEKLALREEQIEHYYAPNTSARLTSTKSFIQIMAYSKQIDERFKNDEEALRAADFIYKNASNCLKDNLGSNGTMTIPAVGLIRLLLNGAYDYLQDENGGKNNV